MGRRHLVIGSVVLGVLGALSWQVWGRGRPVDARELVAMREPVRDARVLPAVLQRVARPPVIEVDNDFIEEVEIIGHGYASPFIEVDPDAEVVDSDGLTIEERWAGTIAELEDRLPRDRGLVQGRVRDARSGEALAGATVVLSVTGQPGEQVVITDPDGFYVFANLTPGDYVVTVYFIETTLVRAITVVPREATPVYVSISQPVVEQPVGFTGVEDQNNTYYVDGIDTTGLSFSSNCGNENTYVIDGEDTPGITITDTYAATQHVVIDETDAFQETK